MQLDREKLSARLCFVTDWLTNIGGGEKVLHALADLYPAAPIFTTVCDHEPIRELFPDLSRIKTSYLQHLPVIHRRHQFLLPFLSHAIESHDLSEFDTIVSLSSCVAKNVKKTRAGQLHVCYIHTPIRYAWEPGLDPRVENLPWGLRNLASLALSAIRRHDYNCRRRPDFYIANSSGTRAKVSEFYGLEARVLYPPYEDIASVDDDDVPPGDFYLALGRQVPYKRFDLAINAFRQMPSCRLLLAGSGPEELRLKQLAAGSSNITFVGRVSEQEKSELLTKAKAFILPQREDAGIVQLEAMARGTPVIAFAGGGALDVVKHGLNGILFPEQSVDSLKLAVESMETDRSRFARSVVSSSVAGFSRSEFQQKFQGLMESFQGAPGSVQTSSTVRAASRVVRTPA